VDAIAGIVFRSLTRNSRGDLADLLSAALPVEDPLIRLWVARAATAKLRGADLRGILDGLSSDPSGLVRREALAGWADFFPDEAVDRLMAGVRRDAQTEADKPPADREHRGPGAGVVGVGGYPTVCGSLAAGANNAATAPAGSWITQ
jgi:hypothetical protein